ncbi:LysM peptidoglycan-binding domain-containing protein [Chitinophaga pendula]|uniref:DPBB and LysM peptidoglycan-binding domain-containing protein n=1 Tax=Chitinophaga pendula TaxID=2849666 RepID=UPI001CECB02C|nr:LysM peptidoglycan-binding domain-containing protein [Chitinophaga pendula]UCJ08068.1 LysM peptidoglycan-binding domain-containing protein [Chitinophaga pendula]
MVKSIMPVLAFVLSAATVQAQDTLEVQGTTPDLYVTHAVKKGETFYSLGRAYGLPPKEIAAKNNLAFDQGLQLGQHVRIPLTGANFSQAGDVGAPSYRPVYHRVAEKETLYRISVNYNKVALDNVRHWNNLNGDGLKKDSYVIVGWVKGNGSSAVLAANTPAPAPAPVVKQTPAPVSAQPAPKPQETVKQDSNVSTPAPVASKPVTTPPPTPTAPAPAPSSTPPVTVASDASFEQLYQQQVGNGKGVTTEKGPGSWFKSNAGPGKYYALHNTAARGTIIKVTNPLNGRAIYAKVLDAIPQLKTNANLIIKLSDAAMSALGTNETKFYCELSYDD